MVADIVLYSSGTTPLGQFQQGWKDQTASSWEESKMLDFKAIDRSTCAVAVRSFAVVVSNGSSAFRSGIKVKCASDPTLVHATSNDGRAELIFKGVSPQGPALSGKALSLALGPRLHQSEPDECMANAARIDWDPVRGLVRVLSSIVGLPPIFILRHGNCVAIASHVHLLRELTNEPFVLDPRAVMDVYTTGFPLDGRTLFSDVLLMPGGHSFTVDSSIRTAMRCVWDLPRAQRHLDWPSYLQSQEEVRDAAGNLQLSGGLLSLTGGLDTRAILSVLAGAGKPVTAFTTSGTQPSLDAHLAQELCKAYGVRHTLVTLGESFLKALPTYALEASRLSGGISSVEQAHEIYVYEQLGGLGSTRISGYLGNQVGRGGVELVSPRNACTDVLVEPYRQAAVRPAKSHWLTQAAEDTGHPLARFLIQREVPFSSVANFSIGSYHMEQQSPYASRRLIELALLSPRESHEPRIFNVSYARLRDLRHRFLGQSTSRSFQRRLIKTTGGFVAQCPINWGWRAAGGVSLSGLGRGIRALTDALASRPGHRSAVLQCARRALGAHGLHDVRPWHLWLDSALRDFANDTLRSKLVEQTGLLDRAQVTRTLDDHYSGAKSNYKTILATLDLALAHRNFCARA
jgi:hypothetical protein